MFKIKDRVALGVFAGLCGNLTKTAIDELSYQAENFPAVFPGDRFRCMGVKKASS
jgi:hypothetical protein